VRRAGLPRLSLALTPGQRRTAAAFDKMARRELKRSSSTRKTNQSGHSGHAAMPGGHRDMPTIMARKPSELGRDHLERVTGIEPALSAWESDRLGPLTALTWCPMHY